MMREMRHGLVILIVCGCIALSLVAYGIWKHRSAPWLAPLIGREVAEALPGAFATRVSYACEEGKDIEARFANGNALLLLSDGRTVTLHEAPAENGARYADEEGAFVLLLSGNAAEAWEGGISSYAGCIMVRDETDLEEAYASSLFGFSLLYPRGFRVDERYRSVPSGGSEIPGVSFTIPERLSRGTNLSHDTYLSVERLPNVDGCAPLLFLPDGGTTLLLADDDRDYLVASSTSAGAGNRYEEILYTLPLSNPCIAVRYVIHSTVLVDHEPGTVRAFDRALLIETFDRMRRSLVIP